MAVEPEQQHRSLSASLSGPVVVSPVGLILAGLEISDSGPGAVVMSRDTAGSRQFPTRLTTLLQPKLS